MNVPNANKLKNILKVSVSTMFHLCCTHPPPKYEVVKDAIPWLTKIVAEEDDLQILTCSVKTLAYFSGRNEKAHAPKTIHFLIEDKFLKKLISFLS